MKGIKTISQFINFMWKESYFEKPLTVLKIYQITDSNGYTFSKDEIRDALQESEIISRAGKLKNGVVLYKQTHPFSDESSDEEEPIHHKIFKQLDLHPEIRKASSKLFMNGHYYESIFASFKKVNNLVKKKSGKSLDGQKLMYHVFAPDSPVLKLNKLSNESEINEQEGFMHIFAGSIQGIRNPRAHEDEFTERPMKTIEYLVLASLLAKIVTKSKK